MGFIHNYEIVQGLDQLTAGQLAKEEEYLGVIRDTLLTNEWFLNETIAGALNDLRANREAIINGKIAEAEMRKKALGTVKDGFLEYFNYFDKAVNRGYWEEMLAFEEKRLERLQARLTKGDLLKSDIYKSSVLYATSDSETSAEGVLETITTGGIQLNTEMDFLEILAFIETTFLDSFLASELLDENVKDIVRHSVDVTSLQKKLEKAVFDPALYIALCASAIEVARNLNELTEIYFDQFENRLTEYEKRAYYHYSGKAEYTLNDLAYTLIHSPINEINSVLKNKAIDFQGTEETKESLRALTPLQKRVLDIIIGFFKSGLDRFTNSQIAGEIYGQENRKDSEYFRPTLNQLAEIDSAIEKLRRTMIEIKGNTGAEKDTFYNSRNPLISVVNVGKRSEETNIQLYRFTSVPFYYTYNERTNGRYITYNRSTITKEIAGFKKTPRNTDLRIYLQETISNIILGLERAYISLEDVYTIYGAETRKQKQDVRERTEDILKSLKSEYGFTYKLDKKGVKYTGFAITKIRA